MPLETVIGIFLLAIAIIGYAISRLPIKPRMKYVDQKVKVRGEKEYIVVLYI